MGIDAEMLIRLRGDKPTDEQLTRWSWDLCRSIGAGKFFTQDGLAPEKYHEAIAAWHAAFKAHPRYQGYQKNAKDAHSAILADIGNAPEILRRAIELSCRRYPLEDGDTDVPATHRQPGKAWVQDGDPILADEGEWFLEVALWTRYYGVGYERGDLMTICATAEWVEANIPNAEVWYGGDSSGVLAEPFGAAQRAALKKHYYSQQGRDYFNFSSRMPGGVAKMPKPCGLCIPGEPRFNQYGWGDNYAAVNCQGCGKTFVSRDNGVTWTVEKETT